MNFSHRRDYYAGALMVLIGIGAAYIASGYQIGTLTRMGPGYFPIVLGIGLAIIGVIIAGSAAYAPAPATGAEAGPRPDWRGWICITAAAFLFIGLAKYTGIVTATFACVFVAALGDRENTVKSAALLATGVMVCGVGIFYFLLHVQIPLFGSM